MMPNEPARHLLHEALINLYAHLMGENQKDAIMVARAILNTY